jgi:1-deoxy-D-xylulose-5-phosphate reductoisomerase
VVRVAILGSTGSIGRQTLDVIRQHPKDLQVVALTALTNGDILRHQAEEFGVKSLALMSEKAGLSHRIPGGMAAVTDCATLSEADVVVIAVAGVIGLEPTLAAIESGKNIALASKEVLVAAGQVVMPRVKAKGISLTPIDSEHSAVFQCIQAAQPRDVDKIFLTASGGPFRGMSKESLQNVSVAEALNHPTWSMGGKITVDSATLMNKGLEVIEACWLFDLQPSQIEVVVHPQSVVHSMVQFKDTSVLAQMGWPDMRLPIQYSLFYPKRQPNALRPWNPVETPHLTFERPDSETFRCLSLAYLAAAKGGTMPCAMNAANEEAANAFLRGQCGFLQIASVVEQVMEEHIPAEPGLDSILATDAWARGRVAEILSA